MTTDQLIVTRQTDTRFRPDWFITDNAAALFTWDNGQTMRAVTVMETDQSSTSFAGDYRVRCIPRTKTGRDYRGHYGHWLPLGILPDEFEAKLRAALAV